MPGPEEQIEALRIRISELERENAELKKGNQISVKNGKTVSVPEPFSEVFSQAETVVGAYFKNIEMRPSQGTIEINNQRYVLVRASALSIDFFQALLDLYADRGEAEAILIGKSFLFDISHVIGIEDAKNFHSVMNLKDPVEKLSAGPVHFAYSGWAYVDILPESSPTADDHFILKYNHPFSFEADSWMRKKKKADFPVCVMSAGYSSGWCEASFGIPLTAVEITCRAKGDEHCTFIMAPPHKINAYLEAYQPAGKPPEKYDVPMFFERKQAEEKIKASLHEKEVLLREIHHRVKNNLQIISSLLKLQSAFIDHPEMSKVISDSQSRIKTMAIVHEKLYQSDLESVAIGDYIQTVAIFTEQYLSSPETKVVFDFQFSNEPVMLKIDQAIPVGLIVNEVLTNSFKYAFHGRKNGSIRIATGKDQDGLLNLVIADDGTGLPPEINAGTASSFGMELIRMLTEQMDGKMEMKSENGVQYSFTFPL